MTDVRQFGDRETRRLDCARCEAMLADAVDSALAPEEQAFFEAHIADCSPCAQLLAEARRGAAWLEMLRTPAPEPPPALLERILTQTSGNHALHPVSLSQPAPAMAPGYTNVLPFPRRAAAGFRASAFGRLVFEPRLAMTAAMAFLSIALTMDLMGVNPMELRAHDLTPSGLHRAFAQMDARVVQYYEGLRVVYELESRVHDFQSVQQNTQDAAPAQGQTQAPAVTEQTQPSGDTPADDSAQPENQAAPAQPQAQPQSRNAPAQHKAAPADSISRRQETRPAQNRSPLSAFIGGKRNGIPAAVSAAMLEDAIAASGQGDSEADAEAYVGGKSSLVHMELPHVRPAQRRAA